MPTFGDYETSGEPLATADESGHVSQIWLAHKVGANDGQSFALKLYSPQKRRRATPAAEDDLEPDRCLEFLEGIKQIKKSQAQGGKAGRKLTPIHGFGMSEDGKSAWYVTDFYGQPEPFLSRNLQSYIMKEGRLDGAAVRHIIHEVVTGCLALKQSRGCSHGNLKSTNIFRAGKPRLLRQTPIQLADAFPAAPLLLASVDPRYREGVGELLQQTMEAQDLRAIGELMLQLVEGRAVSSERDYDYPVSKSPAWSRLGSEAEALLGLCNDLLNPSLSLHETNLEILERRFRPSPVNAPMALAALAAACLVAGAGYCFYNLQRKQIAVPTQPQSQSGYVGGAATLSVVVKGALPLSYQWRKEGKLLGGETSPILTLNALKPSDAGAYDVIVNNQYRSKTSDVASLTIVVPAPQIVGKPKDAVVLTREGATFTVTASSPLPNIPLTYQWRNGGVAIGGETNPSLVVPGMTSPGVFSYDVIVMNQFGAVTSQMATLKVNIHPPQITVPPADQTQETGSNAVFAVSATGEGSLKYQWIFNGTDKVGATDSSLRLTTLTPANSGSYSVRVYNDGGSTTSQSAILSVHLSAPVQPAEFKNEFQIAKAAYEGATGDQITNLVGALAHMTRALALVPNDSAALELNGKIKQGIDAAVATALQKGTLENRDTNFDEAIKQWRLASFFKPDYAGQQKLSSDIYNTASGIAFSFLTGTNVDLDHAGNLLTNVVKLLDATAASSVEIETTLRSRETEYGSAITDAKNALHAKLDSPKAATQFSNSLSSLEAHKGWKLSNTAAIATILGELYKDRDSGVQTAFRAGTNALAATNKTGASYQLTIINALSASHQLAKELAEKIQKYVPPPPAIPPTKVAISSEPKATPEANPPNAKTIPATPSAQSKVESLATAPFNGPANLTLNEINFVWVPKIGPGKTGAYVATEELSLASFKSLGGVGAGDPTMPATFQSAQEARDFAAKQSRVFAAKGFSVRLPTLSDYLTMAGLPRIVTVIDISGLQEKLRKQNPDPFSTSLGDLNAFGLRNLVGNVREWTSDTDNPFGIPYFVPPNLAGKPGHNDLGGEIKNGELVGIRLVLEP